MILWYVQFLKSKMINIELFSVGSRGEFYLNIASYVSCILRHFVDYGIPLSQIKIVLFLLMLIIVFIFAGQWKARVICSVLILENYPWCVLPLRSIWWTWNIAPLVQSMILKDFFTSFIVESKILRNHWLRNYFVKLVDRGECKIIGTCLTMSGRRIVEFLHKRTRQICSLLAFGKLVSGGFFHCSLLGHLFIA